jgi:predicted nuclease of predicted toxin-antitoxin system
MRFLVDENIPRALVRRLREHDHDVLAAGEGACGATDRTLLRLAEAERRLIVTQDKDFGELAFRENLPAACGIVLFRLEALGRDETAERMLRVLESGIAWAGTFAVVTTNRIRTRPLPGARDRA